MSIRAIDVESVHRITSGQVVVDLQTAVKELVDNALDAEATTITITFREYGLDSIEVQDNGHGIEPADWPSIALKHHTSKLASFDDLTSVATLGFRGEALSSLCAVANLSMVTSTAQSAPIGHMLSFASSGVCRQSGRVARAVGTTVTIKDLFVSMPVRRKALQKSVKREFGKTLELIQAYALFRSSTRFEVKNIVKGKTLIHLQTPSKSSMRSNFSTLFSPKALATMVNFELDFVVEADMATKRWTERDSPFTPLKLPRAFNEVYRTIIPNTFPVIVVDLTIDSDSYDVNVSPDKRTIFLHSENNLITALRAHLEEWLGKARTRYTVANSSSDDQLACEGETARSDNQDGSVEADTGDGSDSHEQEIARSHKRRRMSTRLEEDQDHVVSIVQHPNDCPATTLPDTTSPLLARARFASSFSLGAQNSAAGSGAPLDAVRVSDAADVAKHDSSTQQTRAQRTNGETVQTSLLRFMAAEQDTQALSDVVVDVSGTLAIGPLRSNTTPPKASSPTSISDELTHSNRASHQHPEVDLVDLTGYDDDDSPLETESMAPLCAAADLEQEVGGISEAANLVAAVDLSAIHASWIHRKSKRQQSSARTQVTVPTGPRLENASVDANSAEVEAALSRYVTKADFSTMHVIGQFNHAFIIARRTLADNASSIGQDDLFIVDQHASDEKYNFEVLQKTCVIQSQSLLQPRCLQLPAHEEIAAIEHAEVLRINGFDVMIDPDAAVGDRIKLTAQPVSKSTVFDLNDLEELLNFDTYGRDEAALELPTRTANNEMVGILGQYQLPKWLGLLRFCADYDDEGSWLVNLH
ncbi:ATP-binding mismatch repair protein [Microbotryomycetes sp. JL221]|nr:ATP-binding mismatch repair protein [Microbotryomycetes sp. JL221]